MRNEQTTLVEELIPLSHLTLDPDVWPARTVEQWTHLLDGEVFEDEYGRKCVTATTAKALADEHRAQRERMAEDAARRAETRKPAPVHAGVPALEGATAMEALIAAEAKAGTYTRPSDEYGPGRGNPFQELMDEQLAEGQRLQAEKRRQIAERKRLAEVKEKAKKAREAADKALKPKEKDGRS